jgi:hypothetical protein
MVTKTRPIAFSLIVDDFAVKYVGKHHTDHLINALLQSYDHTTDWEGKVYSGMSLKWDHKNRTCDIYMPGYVSNVLIKLQHESPKHLQHTPSRYVTPVYGAKTQYAMQDETPHNHGQTVFEHTKSHMLRFVLHKSCRPNRLNAPK